MKSRIIIFFLLFGSFCSFGQSGIKLDNFIRNLQKRDTILIGDQVDYGIHLKNIEADKKLEFPVLDSLFRNDSIIVLSEWQLDTIRNEKNVVDIDASVRLTSFVDTLYSLPVLYVKYGRDKLYSYPTNMRVYTMPVDTSNFVLNDIKGQIEYPLTFKEIMTIVLIVISVLLLIAAIVYAILYFVRHRKKKAQEKIAPHILALMTLDKYKDDIYWKADKQKIYYSAITDALRLYMAEVYKFKAMEMTKDEIFSHLDKERIAKELYDEIYNLFSLSDLVKFAKLIATDEDNARAMDTAYKFVTQTYHELIATQLSEQATKN